MSGVISEAKVRRLIQIPKYLISIFLCSQAIIPQGRNISPDNINLKRKTDYFFSSRLIPLLVPLLVPLIYIPGYSRFVNPLINFFSKVDKKTFLGMQ